MKNAKIFAVYLALAAPVASATDLRTTATLERAQTQLLKLRQGSGYWSMPGYLGSHYISQYFVMQRWLRVESSRLKPDVLRSLLLDSQQSDGSWQAVYDATFAGGDLSATIFNYWALKVMGEDTEGRALSRARRFILGEGGIEAAPVLTKAFLALTDNYAWSKLPSLPYLLFMPLSPVNVDQFALWVGPHLEPLAYLKQVRATRQLGAEYDVKELFTSPPAAFDNLTSYQPVEEAPADHKRHVKELLADQQPTGAWGDNTTATILSLAAIQDFSTRWPLSAPETTAIRANALHFVEGLYFTPGKSSYLGVTNTNVDWDTALASNALLDSGIPTDQLLQAMHFLASNADPKPSIDETAEKLIALSRYPQLKAEADRTAAWLVSMQNKDGGFSAYDKDNVGNFMLSYFAGEFSDSTDLFDESTADVTAHALEALAKVGQNRTNSLVVQSAISFLRGAQRSDGSFEGRWGIDTLYGTGAAVVGLVRAGLPVDDGMVVKALDYLAGKQNSDGGFGESARTYADPSYAGKGASTPTQTSWALLALLENRERFSTQIDRGVGFLLTQFEKDGRWIDHSAVGTGHPGLVSMQRPGYAAIFPLQALARYQRQEPE